MKAITRPQTKLHIQFRKFERPKGSGAMKFVASRQLTVHDADLDALYNLLLSAVEKGETDMKKPKRG